MNDNCFPHESVSASTNPCDTISSPSAHIVKRKMFACLIALFLFGKFKNEKNNKTQSGFSRSQSEKVVRNILKYIVVLFSFFFFPSPQLRIEHHLPHQHLYSNRRTSAIKIQYHRQTLSEKHRRPFAVIILIVDLNRFAKVIKVRRISRLSRELNVRRAPRDPVHNHSVQIKRKFAKIDRQFRSRSRTDRRRMAKV